MPATPTFDTGLHARDYPDQFDPTNPTVDSPGADSVEKAPRGKSDAGLLLVSRACQVSSEYFAESEKRLSKASGDSASACNLTARYFCHSPGSKVLIKTIIHSCNTPSTTQLLQMTQLRWPDTF